MTLYTQQTRHIYLIFDQFWANVVDGGPILVKHWVEVSYFCWVRSIERVQNLSMHVGRLYNITDED